MIEEGKSDLVRASSDLLKPPSRIRKSKKQSSEQGGGCLHSPVSAERSGDTGDPDIAKGDCGDAKTAEKSDVFESNMKQNLASESERDSDRVIKVESAKQEQDGKNVEKKGFLKKIKNIFKLQFIVFFEYVCYKYL